MKRLIGLAAAVFVGCADGGPVSPGLLDSEFGGAAHRSGALAHGITVMTQNVYVGADVDKILEAGAPEEIPGLVAEAFQTLLATNFPERAAAFAREIGHVNPDLIGLQEISTVRYQSPGDAVIGGTIPAEFVLFDYLDILMQTLKAHDLHYRVVAAVQNPDVEVPMIVSLDPLAFDDVRLTDYDVILARHDVEVSDVMEKNYDARLTVGIGDVAIEIPRGYVAVTALVRGHSYRFVNTHLEPAYFPVQYAQGSELRHDLLDEDRPVVLVGDLNTPSPDGGTYVAFLESAYVDVWSRGGAPGATGFTCCNPLDLRGDPDFVKRIDHVLVREGEGRDFEVLRLGVVGDKEAHQTATGMWPSDHGGVIADLRFRREY